MKGIRPHWKFKIKPQCNAMSELKHWQKQKGLTTSSVTKDGKLKEFTGYADRSEIWYPHLGKSLGTPGKEK